jgi:hypothetical protein
MNNSFGEIFNSVFSDKRYENDGAKEADKSFYEQRFVWWLQETKSLKYGDEKKYKKYLNMKVFHEFLDHEWNKVSNDEYDKLVNEEEKKFKDAFDARYKVEGEAGKRILLQRESESYEKLFDAKLLELKEPLSRKDSPLKAVKELEELSSFNIWEIRKSYDFIKECETHGSFYATPQNIRILALSKHREYLIEKRELSLKEIINEEKIKDYQIKDPFYLMVPELIGSFLEKEKEVTGQEGKWPDSSIRLAAFCEILFEKKYLVERKNRIKACNDFAKSRYGIDIKNSLLASKKNEREEHKTRIKNKKIRLNDYFR